MTTRSQVEGARSSGSRWSKWSKYAVVGVASLAVMASGMPTADAAAANPALAAAHFRGPQAHGAYAYAQAHAQAFSLVQHNTQRRLDANSTMNDAVNKANEVGASARKAVKQMRGGTDKFYNDLISAVKVTLCNELVKKNQAGKNPKDRFVDFSDTRAYKDSNGDCMRVKNATETDSKVLEEYTNGRCEVKPNCYWGEVYSNETDRHPVYATGEAFPPEIEMTAGDADDFIKKKWAQGLMIFVVPGIILAVLSLLTMIFFLICRCCCNRCGGRSPREGGYTCMQKFLPLLFYLLFSAGVIIVVGVSVLYQGTVTTAVSDMFQDTSDTLGGANTWILAIESPLKSVRDTVESSATKIKVQLAGTDFINDGLTGLTGRLTTFGKYSANRTLPEGCKVSSDDQYCFPCDFCTTISTEVDKSTKQIEANAGEGVAKLKTVKEALNDKLVSIADSVKSMVNNQLEMLDTLITTVTDVQTQVGDIQGQYEKQKAAQKAAVVGPFAFALVTIAIGFIGVLFGLTPLKFLANIIHIAYIIGFIALLVTFLLSSVFLAISVVLGDVCEVTAVLQKDWTVALGEEAKGINACFTGTSLIETFNLSSSLEFARGGLKFPDNNLTKMLDFSDFDKFTTAIKATDDSTFNADLTQINKLVTAVNALVKQSTGQCTPNDVYTKADLLTPWTKNGESQTEDQTPEEYIKARYTVFDNTCDKTKSPAPKPYTCNPESPCEFSDAVEQLFHGAKALTLVGRDSKGFIDNLHTNITVVTDYTDEFKGKIKVFDGKITTIRTDLQDSLIKSVDEFEKAMYCTFVAEGYSNIYESLCGKLMPALTMISLMIFLAGVFLFPVNVCLIIACKRLKARGSGGHVMDNEMKFK